MAHLPQWVCRGPTKAEVNLANFRENVKTFRRIADDAGTLLMAVIKTNAYGHGLVPIAHAAIKAGADRLGVTTMEEGVLLRENDIDAPIHLLSPIIPEQAEDTVTYDLTASVSSCEQAKAIHTAAISQQKIVPVHLKVDTGLHRFGIAPEYALDFCRWCYHLSGLYWEGIYTHFSTANNKYRKTTEAQFTLLMDTITGLNDYGYHFPIRHAGASTIALRRPDMHLDMIRPGIALFGYTPDIQHQALTSIRPVMSLKSRILQVRSLPPGTPVGYGGSYITTERETLAVVPVGHGHGYKRALSNNGEVLIRGMRAAIVGEISLDQLIVRITHINGVSEGDEVVLIGEQGADEIFAREIAEHAQTIVDDVLSSLMERVYRVYK
ncbi:alanine racemase [Lentibacillus halophilus]|uniref:Alanine racemase n=1 Tax=Lentibacillus halophilus TaxID=295065 RepID=A0ABP3JA98_9BACI